MHDRDPEFEKLLGMNKIMIACMGLRENLMTMQILIDGLKRQKKCIGDEHSGDLGEYLEQLEYLRQGIEQNRHDILKGLGRDQA